MMGLNDAEMRRIERGQVPCGPHCDGPHQEGVFQVAASMVRRGLLHFCDCELYDAIHARPTSLGLTAYRCELAARGSYEVQS